MEYMEEGSLADTLKDRRLSEKAGPGLKKQWFHIFLFDLDFLKSSPKFQSALRPNLSNSQ